MCVGLVVLNLLTLLYRPDTLSLLQNVNETPN